MSQHGRFEQDYLRMKVQIDKLKASGLSEEQRTIFFETGQNDTAFRASSFH